MEGIKKKIKLNGKIFKAWVIAIRDNENIETFKDVITPFCLPSQKLNNILHREVSSKMLEESGQFYKRIPHQAAIIIAESLKGATRHSKKTVADLWRFASNTKNPTFARGASEYLRTIIKRKSRLYPSFVNKAGRYLNNENLINIASGDLIFDEITKITWNEPELCWDMQCEETHQSFLCEHVFTHNTFCMVQIGKACAMSRLKVLHISLEMSEPLMAQRYMQTFFSLSKRKAEVTVNRFVHDERGRLTTFTTEELKRPTLQDPSMESQLTTKLNKLKNRIQLEIKRFPTGALTMDGLEAFLDGNERLYGFTPDVLLLDYADLMKLDYKNLRTSTGEIYKELRRIAVERNIALVTASQSNRLGEDSRVITLKHLAEDYSKAVEDQRDALRAKVEAMEKQESVAEWLPLDSGEDTRRD